MSCVKHLSQFGLNFFAKDSKTTLVTFNMFFECWFLPTQNLAGGYAVNHKLLNQFRKVGQTIYDYYPVYDVKVELTLGEAWGFMLGFDDTEFVFKQQFSRKVKAEEVMVIKGSLVVDKGAGLNFMFLECNKIENVIVAFKRRRTMLIAPLKWYDPCDDHMIESYLPITKENSYQEYIVIYILKH